MRHLGAVVLLFSLGCGDTQLPVQPTPSLPAPTPQVFSLSGSVRDTARRPLGGSRVEVIDGQRASMVTTTDETGRFSMPGPFTGTVTVTASKDGYVPATTTVPTNPPPNRPLPPGEVRRWDFNFSLQPHGPSANIAGVYTLTLTADSACTNLPDEARTRTYTATIVPTSGSTTSFLARLSDARFFSSYSTFGIQTAGDFARFGVWGTPFDVDVGYDDPGPGIVEQVRETTYLAIGGSTGASFGPSGITAPFDGYFEYCPSETALTGGQWCLASARVQYHCDSHNHQLTLVRR